MDRRNVAIASALGVTVAVFVLFAVFSSSSSGSYAEPPLPLSSRLSTPPAMDEIERERHAAIEVAEAKKPEDGEVAALKTQIARLSAELEKRSQATEIDEDSISVMLSIMVDLGIEHNDPYTKNPGAVSDLLSKPYVAVSSVYAPSDILLTAEKRKSVFEAMSESDRSMLTHIHIMSWYVGSQIDLPLTERMRDKSLVIGDEERRAAADALRKIHKLNAAMRETCKSIVAPYFSSVRSDG